MGSVCILHWGGCLIFCIFRSVCILGGVGLSFEEAESCFVLPLRSAGAHLSSQDSGSPETEVGSLDDGYAHLSISNATYTSE